MRARCGFVCLSLLTLGGCDGNATRSQHSFDIVAGAGFTTVDSTILGCQNGSGAINCNIYDAKSSVYMSGGPGPSGLSDGDYYFAVLTPGSQNGGFIDGAVGNLSDTTVGGTTGDNGSGDLIPNRTFTVANHEIVAYAGTHAIGTSLKGRFIIGLAPFDDTDNPGGVYILAICQVGATSASQCKYDAFKIHESGGGGSGGSGGCIDFGKVEGGKYYDANANGQWDSGEPGIGGWPIHLTDAVSDTVYTDGSGTFTVQLLADTYTFTEGQPTNTAGTPHGTLPAWFETGNTVSQLAFVGGSSGFLFYQPTPQGVVSSYYLTVVDCSDTTGVYFGNLCIGRGGGLTLGFWSNKNGQALVTLPDLGFLAGLNLVNGSGAPFDPCVSNLKTCYSGFRTWLLGASATNMAYMLSAQLAAMELNARHGFVSGSALVYSPGSPSASAAGFTTIDALMAEANASLGANPYTVGAGSVRSYQEALKNALDNANNDKTFVQPSPASCPAPTF